MKLPAYPRTKPSGVEWLGDVPEHWEAKRLKYSASINDEALPETTLPDFEFEYVDIGGVSAVDGITATEQVVFESAPSRARRKVRHGDTIVSTVRTYLRAIAPIKNPPKNLIVSTGFAVVRPRKVEPAFLAYALRESSYVESVVARSVGVSYPACNASEVGGIAIPLPDSAEQRAIAAFLDRETGRVDRLVAKKRELIERLKEKRTALISRTVTRGLPPAAARAAGLPANPPLKPSGVEWLGEIPKHWELLTWRRLILSLKDFGSNGSFAGLKENVEYLHEPDFAQLIRLTDLRGDLEHEGAIYVSEESFKYLKHSSLQGGEFLIANVGAHAGLVVEMPKIDRPATLGPNMMFAKRIREDKVSTRYLILSAQSDLIRSQLTMIANASSAQPKLNKDDVRSVVTPLPPLPEQAAIAAYLDEETAKLDALVGKVEEAVERLQEYRTALITAAVTGKIDVRKAVGA